MSDVLSPREKQVYEQHLLGRNTREIARVIGCTPSAVTQAKASLRRKHVDVPYEPKHFGAQERQAEENRRRILNAVVDGFSTVKAVAQQVHLSEACVTDHMAKLRTARLVTWQYGTITLTADGREKYKPDDYDEIYPNGGQSLAHFERLFDQIAAGRNG